MFYSVKDEWFKSPGYLTCDLPQCCIDELTETIAKLESGEIEKIDNRPGGQRHLAQEWRLPIGPNIRYITESMCYDYDRIFKGGDHVFQEYFHTSDHHKISYDTKGMWINYSRRGDFNPPHVHEGMFAFVIWVKIPYDLEEETSRYNSCSNLASQFTFNWLNAKGKLRTTPLNIDKSWEWRIALFDAFLPHSVFPFYTSDEWRITIAGDIYAKIDPDKDQT
jgi:hypothetical protein